MSLVQDVADFAVEVADTSARFIADPSLAMARELRPKVASQIGRVAELVEQSAAFVPLDGADDYNAADTIRAALWVYQTRRTLYALRAALVTTQASIDTILRGVVPTRRHVVVSGDTLEQIAARYLGDWRLWLRIADHNRLDPATALVAGTVLDLPDPVV